MNYNDFKGRGIPKFPKNSRVCFVGDSLTAGAVWTEMIFEYYLKHFPEDKVRMYNVGIGGGTVDYEMEHLDEDLFRHNPTHAVIMYSVNDINGYGGTAEMREKRFYADMKRMTDTLISRGVTVYYMCPTESPEEKKDGCIPRKIAHDVMMSLAREYNSYCCDLYSIMTPLLECADMIAEDKTHHTAIGDRVIGRIFLHTQGFDGFTPDDEGFFDCHALSYEVSHRMIFQSKIRRIWTTMRNISTTGDTTEAKINRLYGRIRTRADGAWDDFCYYLAVDFIELYPNMDFYYGMVESITDELVGG